MIYFFLCIYLRQTSVETVFVDPGKKKETGEFLLVYFLDEMITTADRNSAAVHF